MAVMLEGVTLLDALMGMVDQAAAARPAQQAAIAAAAARPAGKAPARAAPEDDRQPGLLLGPVSPPSPESLDPPARSA